MTEQQRKALEAARRLRERLDNRLVASAKLYVRSYQRDAVARWSLPHSAVIPFADAFDELEREEADVKRIR